MTFDYHPKVDQHNGLLNHGGTFLNDVKFLMRIFFWEIVIIIMMVDLYTLFKAIPKLLIRQN